MQTMWVWPEKNPMHAPEMTKFPEPYLQKVALIIAVTHFMTAWETALSYNAYLHTIK